MRASQTAIVQDFRLADCKHERLRRALEFRRSGPASLAIPTETSGDAAGSDEPKRTLFGALGLFSLACGWFLWGSVASIDFSRFEADLNLPRTVSQSVAPASRS